jgi:hypothetical protein
MATALAKGFPPNVLGIITNKTMKSSLKTNAKETQHV